MLVVSATASKQSGPVLFSCAHLRGGDALAPQIKAQKPLKLILYQFYGYIWGMISIRQLRAARALLGWKQSDLAAKSGLSLTALNNIERETVSPRLTTMTIIQDAFEREGIQFTDDDGLKMRSEIFDIKTIEGSERDVVQAHLDEILTTLEKDGGTALYGGVEESFYIKHCRQECFDFYTQFKANKFKERILICEGVTQRYGPKETSEYRALPKELFGMISYAVYGNKYNIMMLGKKSRFITIEHPGVAAVHRQLFETHWKMARFVPFTRPLYDVDLESGKYRS
jgi:transcriptional regulator with XRE-family HTH domain